jgi:membrane protein
MSLRAVLVATINGWFNDRTPRSAAALAYYAVFSLAPLLLIVIGLGGIVLGRDAAREAVLEQAAALVGSQGAQAIEAVMGDREAADLSGGISAIVGFVLLLVGAVAVLAQLKEALNAVWNVESEGASVRSFIGRYVANMGLVIAAGFLLLVSLLATAFVNAATRATREWLPGPDVLWYGIDATAGLALTTLVFALIFKVLPDAQVAWREVLPGALFTAVLFTLGRFALGAYLGRNGSDSAYGAAGSVLALLAWVYYSAQLVLFGAEFTYHYARARGPFVAPVARRPAAGPGAPVPPTAIFLGGFLGALLCHRLDPWPIPSGSLTPFWNLIGAGLLAGGALLFLLGVLTFCRARTGVMLQAAATRIVAIGPYRWSRNPQYLALTAVYLGAAVYAQSLWPVIALPLILLAVSSLVIAREERYLHRRFKDEYREYCRHVPRWL